MRTCHSQFIPVFLDTLSEIGASQISCGQDVGKTLVEVNGVDREHGACTGSVRSALFDLHLVTFSSNTTLLPCIVVLLLSSTNREHPSFILWSYSTGTWQPRHKQRSLIAHQRLDYGFIRVFQVQVAEGAATSDDRWSSYRCLESQARDHVDLAVGRWH